MVYKLTLSVVLTKHHNAVCDEERNVQIKSTFGTSLTFPVHHVPDYYLGIRMNRDGTFEEIYNGPGALIQQQLAGRKPTRTGLHDGLMAMLRRINATVAEDDRIPWR